MEQRRKKIKCETYRDSMQNYKNMRYHLHSYAESIGKEKTGILELYMLAFKLAVKQLEDGGNEYAKL